MMGITIILLIVFIIIQWVIVGLITFNPYDEDITIKTKKQLLLWLIPFYMPIKALIKKYKGLE